MALVDIPTMIDGLAGVHDGRRSIMYVVGFTLESGSDCARGHLRNFKEGQTMLSSSIVPSFT